MRAAAAVLLASLGFAGAFRTVPRAARAGCRAPMATAEDYEFPMKTIEVCVRRKCARKGGKKALERLKELVGDKVAVLENDECFCECELGPNLRIDEDQRKIVNDIASENALRKILGLPEDPDAAPKL